MGTAFGGIDIVGKGDKGFIIAGGILHGDLCHGGVFHPAYVDDLFMDRLFAFIQVGNKFLDTPFITHGFALLFFAPQILKNDFEAGVQKGLLTKAL